MTHPELASWLVGQEIGDEHDTRSLSAAAEQVCQKLSRRLSRLVSPTGSQAIVSRALHLARADFPFLDRVRAGRPPGVCLEALDESLGTVGTDAAGRAVLTLLSTLLDLLVGFIGDDLTLRLVGEVWPDVPVREPSQPGDADHLEANS